MTDRLDLFGWDTVFATSFTKLNAAIVAQKTTPPDFSYTDTGAGVSIKGHWGDWQLTTGGDGQNLQLHCPVTRGRAVGAGDYDLAGGWVQIQVRLDRLPDPSYPHTDPTGTGGTPHKLVVSTKGDAQNPAVSVISMSYKPKSAWKYMLQGLFQAWFEANIAAFNQVFAVTLLDVKAAKGDYQWLKPAELSYACADANTPSLDTSVFSALCLTGKQGTLPAHQVDARLLTGLVQGADSVFAISPEQFVKHLLVTGATYTLHGSQPADYDITNDNLWIQNNKDLTWGNFELDSGKRVSPVIRKGNFQLGLQDQYIDVTITDATFNWPDWHLPGEITIHMNYHQQFELCLKETSKGHVLVPKDGLPKMSMTSTVVASQAVLTTEIVIGLVSGVVLAVVGGAIGGALSGTAEAGVESATEGTIVATEEAVEEAAEQAGEQAVAEAEQEAAEGASADIAAADKPGYLQRFGSAIARNKYKITGGVIGGVLAVPTGLVAQFMELIAEKDLEDIPPFEHFAANCSGATTFPDVGTSWSPVAAGLQGPLLIQGKFGN